MLYLMNAATLMGGPIGWIGVTLIAMGVLYVRLEWRSGGLQWLRFRQPRWLQKR